MNWKSWCRESDLQLNHQPTISFTTECITKSHTIRLFPKEMWFESMDGLSGSWGMILSPFWFWFWLSAIRRLYRIDFDVTSLPYRFSISTKMCISQYVWKWVFVIMKHRDCLFVVHIGKYPHRQISYNFNWGLSDLVHFLFFVISTCSFCADLQIHFFPHFTICERYYAICVHQIKRISIIFMWL